MLKGKEKKFYELATIGGMTAEEAYQATYAPKDRKTLLTVLNRKRKTNPMLFEKIDTYKSELFGKAKEAQTQTVLKSARETVLSALQKREILRKMIEGDLRQEEIVIMRNRIKRVMRKPSNHEKIRAIHADNLMAGHLAPTSVRHEAPDIFMQFMKKALITSNPSIPNEITH